MLYNRIIKRFQLNVRYNKVSIDIVYLVIVIIQKYGFEIFSCSPVYLHLRLTFTLQLR